MPPVVPPNIGLLPLPRRTSISRMSSKEKIGLHEREKHPPPALPSSPAVDEEEEGQTGQSQAKASSSSSSEEESESESDTESATESPGSWRTSLRKAGSSVTLGSAGLSDSIQDTSRTTDSGLGMSRSASSPRLSSEAETKVHTRLQDLCAYKSTTEQMEKKEPPSTNTSVSQSMTTSEQESKQRRKSYLTPVRDEEAEAQRKARSRHARQSRRSTQVLVDLRADNQRLKDENGALIRVISKLSK
ncbi:hypothetical protein GOODEAATRI_000335 [Goodea atripinnis]|uniref:cGMP-dependent protein kinase interacting domain-containing protein n=1 Tax=Goodea atripinnis TaxID=208336 RepID=A0ABV0PUI9_9TELE